MYVASRAFKYNQIQHHSNDAGRTSVNSLVQLCWFWKRQHVMKFIQVQQQSTYDCWYSQRVCRLRETRLSSPCIENTICWGKTSNLDEESDKLNAHSPIIHTEDLIIMPFYHLQWETNKSCLSPLLGFQHGLPQHPHIHSGALLSR